MEILLCIWLILNLVCCVSSASNLNICILHQQDFMISNITIDRYLGEFVEKFDARGPNTDTQLNTSLLEVSGSHFLNFAEKGCHVPAYCNGLVTIADCSYSSLVNIWTSEHLIPHVILNHKTCDHKLDYGIKLTSYSLSQIEAIMAVVHREGWADITILHDSSLDSKEMKRFVTQLSENYIGIICLQIDNTNNTDQISSHLDMILQSQYRNIVVMASADIIRNIFKLAWNRFMVDFTYYWLISDDSMLPDTLSGINISTSNIAVLKPAYPLYTQQPCLPSRLSCSTKSTSEMLRLRLLDALELLTVAITNSMLSEPYNTCSNQGQDIQLRRTLSQRLKQTELVGNLGYLKFNKQGYLHDVQFNICNTHDLQKNKFQKIGHWSTAGFVFKESTVFPKAFTDFGNKTLIIGTLQALPFTLKKVIGNQTKWEGFCIDILNELATRFKFKYIIAEPEDKLWGAPEDDGRWNGIVGEVIRENYAFGVGPFTITSIRETVIDFTKPYIEEGIGILTRRPNSESQKMFKMFSPFAPEVWGCIVVCVAVVGILLYLVNRFSPYSDHNVFVQTEKISLKESLWVVYGSYMEQGGEPHPRSVSGRLILGFWWLFTILMASTYTANLAAFLTVTIAEKPINSLTELSEQSEIKPLAKYGSNLYTLFKEAEGGIYEDIWKMMDGMPKINNNEDALDIVNDGTTAFMTDRSQLEYIVLNDCETYSLADEPFNTAGLGFILPENAKFMNAFNYNIMKMQEAGLIDKWKQKWWPSSDKCSGSDRTSQAKKLDLESLAGPFFIFISVASVAAILLFSELCLCSKSMNKCVQISRHKNNKDTNNPDVDEHIKKPVPDNSGSKK